MKNWTIGKRITFGFAIMLVIMLALSLFIRTRISTIQTGTLAVATDTIPSLGLLADAKENANDSRVLTYKHIYSPDPADMSQIEAKINTESEQVNKDLDTYEPMASPACKSLLNQAKAEREKYRAVRAEILALSRAATNANASALVYQQARADLDPVTTAYSTALSNCEEQEKKEAKDTSEAMLSAVRSTNVGLIIGLALALALASSLGYFIIQTTTRILNRVSSALADGSNQVVSASGQVSAASQTLAEGANQQAASLEETSSSLEEMSSMTKRNSENSRKANDLAKEARASADKGVGDMETMNAAMQAIKASSDDIAKIIKTIDEIAFQTNILALNAAVEAARAGEAGMGFAVVADEVRNLAQRSAQAAKETAAKIEGAIVNTGQGVEISSKVAAVLNEIVTKVRQVDELIAEVAGASREQTDGITQINTAVGQMDKVTQSNAATAEESAAAAEELNAQAESMKQSVGELLELVGGQKGDAANKPAPRTTRTNGFPAAAPKAKSSHAVSRHGQGHGLTHAATGTSAKGRSEIPMEGDFRDF